METPFLTVIANTPPLPFDLGVDDMFRTRAAAPPLREPKLPELAKPAPVPKSAPVVGQHILPPAWTPPPPIQWDRPVLAGNVPHPSEPPVQEPATFGPATRAPTSHSPASGPAAASGLPQVVPILLAVSGGLSLVVILRYLWPGLGLLTRSTAAANGTHPVRDHIAQVVMGNPGITFTALRAAVGCSAGTAQHHLGILEKAGVLRCVRVRRRCHVFQAKAPMDPLVMATLLRGRARDLADSVLVEPGVVQKSLTGRLGMTRRTARRLLDGLVAHGLVKEQVRGRSRAYFPSPQLGQLLATS